MLRSTDRYFLSACLLLLLAISPSLSLGLQKELAIGGGEATSTLQEFSKLTGIQVLYEWDKILGARTHSANASFRPARVLETMFEGSCLHYRFVKPKTVAVRCLPVPPTPSEVLITTRRIADEGWSVDPKTQKFSPDHFRGVGPLETSDFLYAFPQQTGTLCDDGFDSISREGRSNSARVCGVNWRGLGSSSMLVLLEGRRLAGSGTGGLFTNITQIPLSVIETVDITPDGSSARYGSDAISGVANFRLRRDFEGAKTELTLVPDMGGGSTQVKLSQLVGTQVGRSNWLFGFDYLFRDAVPAHRRAQGTSDLTPFGGENFDWAYGDPGNILLPSGIYAIPALAPGQALSPTDFKKRTPNIYDTRVGTNLLPRTKTLSGVIAGQIDRDAGHLNVVAVVTKRLVEDYTTAVGLPLVITPKSPFYFNPTGGLDVEQVEYGFLRNLGPTALHDNVVDGTFSVAFSRNADDGINADAFMSHSFERLRETVDGVVNQTGLQAALTSSLPEHALDPYQDGVTTAETWRSIEGQSRYGSNSSLTEIGATIGGGFSALHERLLHVKVGMDWRRETLNSISESAGNSSKVSTSEGRNVVSGFAIACVPIMGPKYRLCDDPESRDYPKSAETSGGVDLELSGRYDHYSDSSGRVTPAVSVNWRPLASMAMNFSWSLSSHPGGLSDLSKAQNELQSVLLPDASSPTHYAQTLIRSGSNPQLAPESAQSFTFTAQWVPDGTFKASAHVFYTDLKNMIDTPALSADVLSDPNFSNHVIRNPTAGQLADICLQSNYAAGYSACIAGPVDAIVDVRLQSVSRVITDGVDLALDKVWETRWGRWDLKLDQTYVDRFAVTEAGVTQNQVNTVGRPLRFKSQGSVGWSRQHWSATMAIAYKGGYHDTASIPVRDVRSWTVVDLELGWKSLPGGGSIWANTRVTAGAHNLFQRTPSFVNNTIGLGYDPFNGNQLGRFFYFKFTKEFGRDAGRDLHAESILNDVAEDL